MSVKAYGSKFEYGNTADYATASVWTAIASVKSIKPNKVTAKDINTTVLDSPDEFEESLPGLASGGEVELSIRYDETATGTLYGFFRATKAFRIVYPNGSGWKFNGYIAEWGDEEIVNGEIIMTGMKVKVTGKPVPASSGLS